MRALSERLFMVGMWWRIGYGVLRILFGLAILNVVGSTLLDVLTALMGHELTEDPQDVLYTFFSHILAGHTFYISYFLAFYFIFWGIVDVVLSYNLIKHRLWAFPASFVIMGTFVLYECVRFSFTHSLILLWVTFIDAVVVGLIWREYKKLKRKEKETTAG